MGVRRVTPPTVEPIDLDEAKAHLLLNEDTDQDEDLARFISRCRARVERDTGWSLLTQEWELVLDRFPCEDDEHGAVIRLPMGRVQAIGEIRYFDEDGVEQVLAPSAYVLGNSTNPARVASKGGDGWPETEDRIEAVTVTYAAGFGDAPEDIPEDLVHAVRLLLGHWHLNREAVVTGTIATEIQNSYLDIIRSHRCDR